MATADEKKLTENNLAVLCRVLEALSYLRDSTGYGSIELIVQDGLVLRCNTLIKDKVDSP